MCIFSNSPSVLLTRNIDDNQALSVILESQGFRTFQTPFLKIVPLSFDKSFLLNQLSVTDALVITSRHTIIQHLDFWENTAPLFQNIPVYVVGHKTQQAVHSFLPNIVTVQDNAEALYPFIKEKSHPVFLSGEDYAADFKDKNGHSVLRIPVYKAEKASDFEDSLIKTFQQKAIDIVLFYSTKTAQHFEQVLIQTFGEKAYQLAQSVHSVCISSKIAQALTLPWKSRYTTPADRMVSFLVHQFL